MGLNSHSDFPRCEVAKAELIDCGAARRARMLCGMFSVIRREANGKLRSLLILVAICFSATAFAQGAPPKAGNKPVVRVKPKEPSGCKLVGTVRGTKLWLVTA